MSFDPYSEWLEIPADRRPPSYYDLLGLPALEQNVELIHARILEQSAKVRRYQLSDKSAIVQQLLAELSQALACLSDPARKTAYDKQLSGMATVGARSPDETHADRPLITTAASERPLAAASLTRRRRQASPVAWALPTALLVLAGGIWYALRQEAVTQPSVAGDRKPEVGKAGERVTAQPANASAKQVSYDRRQLAADLYAAGLELEYLEAIPVPVAEAKAHLYRVARTCLEAIDFNTAADAQRMGDELKAALSEGRTLRLLTREIGSTAVVYRKGRLIVAYDGRDPALRKKLGDRLGPPLAEASWQPKVDLSRGLLGQFLTEPRPTGWAGSEVRTNISNQPTGTLAAWIKPHGSNRVKYMESVIEADLPGQAGSGWGLCDGRLKVILDNEFWQTDLAVAMHEWQHVALTFDAREARIFLDGRLAAIHSYQQGHVSSQRYMIGKSAANALWFQGLIQDARIYDHVLAPQAIEALAASPPADR